MGWKFYGRILVIQLLLIIQIYTFFHCLKNTKSILSILCFHKMK